jgi:serine/threonine protein phosphatase PrpC
VKINAYGLTDQGRVRPHNEDFFTINTEKSLYLLADGMGGHNAGEVASKETCLSYERYFNKNNEEIEAHLKEVFEKTNKRIFTQSKKSAHYRNMGATFIVCHVREAAAHILHAGDVRAYHFRDRTLIQITEDHSSVSELVKLGQITKEQAKNHPFRNRVTRAVGPKDTISPDYNKIELTEHDIVCLCSDGLWGMVDDDKILSVLAKQADIESKSLELIDQALAAGGTDNITVLLIECGRN